MVEATGVEPDTRVENAQDIDFGNARIGLPILLSGHWYSHFSGFQDRPNSTFRQSPLREKNILK
jgi:hypothetical protein